MVLNITLATLAFVSLGLTLWQWVVAIRFPAHRRVADKDFTPPLTLLKPLKGADVETWHCLESWLTQDYAGPVQILFGAASADDPACEIVRQLIAAHPQQEARLVICAESLGANSKVSTLIQLHRRARQPVVVVSDADVCVPPDFLVNFVGPLRDPAAGLVTCFYRLANPSTLAMQWEAIAINADFWSQVLQARSLKPLDFALGAVMVIRREQLEEIGGFRAVVDCLADDYQLGNRIARLGLRIAISPVVAECWSAPMGWTAVWKHQLRWARTIRVCQPRPYFFSILSNATLWPLLWLLASPSSLALAFCAGCCLLRGWAALDLQQRLTRSRAHVDYWWFVPIKDLLQAVIWLAAFLGNRIEWRGERMLLRRDGTLVRGAPQLFEH